MREYIRMNAPGGVFFLTLVTFDRRPILADDGRIAGLRAAFRAVRAAHPFEIWGAVVLPDHLHVVIELPPGDSDFSTRVALIKSRFSRIASRDAIAEPAASASRQRRRERAVSQRRFWEHTIRDERDLDAHMDYIHYNPVKHRLAQCPHAWPWSSFGRWVRAGRYAGDWACSCRRSVPPPSGLAMVVGDAGE
jgi:putative transposase